MQTPQTERLTYTIEEACDRLGIGRTLGYELARRGELPGVIRLGRRLLVSRPALEKALGLDASRPDDADPEAA